MKKYFILLTLILAFVSCDSVDKDNRYIEVEGTVMKRKVFLEEFTGQRCVNCPKAHAVIEKLEEQYGEDLIVVSIHAGSFGVRAPYGLMQEEEGNAYANAWNVDSYPCGVVDMKGSVMTYDQWATAIRTAGEVASNIDLDLKAELSSDGNTIYVTSTLLSDNNASGKLLLWVVENGIVAYQLDGDNPLQDYVHNNVFRACINGLWGQDVTLTANESQQFDNSIAVDKDDTSAVSAWNVNNLYVVGLVYNGSGVEVVNRVKVE